MIFEKKQGNRGSSWLWVQWEGRLTWTTCPNLQLPVWTDDLHTHNNTTQLKMEEVSLYSYEGQREINQVSKSILMDDDNNQKESV